MKGAVEPEAIGAAAACLDEGGVVAFPTETYYGLAVRPDRPEALARLTALKGRPEGLPTIAADLAAARGWALIPAAAERIVAVLWPGAITLLAKPATPVAAALLGGGGELAIRVSPHPVAQALAAAAGGIITATSANRRGEVPVTEAGALDPDLLAGVDRVLDGGRTPGGAPSTIVGLDRRGERFVIYRPGAIPSVALAPILGYVPGAVKKR